MTASLLSSFSAALARWGKTLWKLLFLSLADDRLAPRRHLSVLLESRGVLLECVSRFLGCERYRGARRYPFGEGGFPTPDALAAAVSLGAIELKASGVPVTLVVPDTWAIIKTTTFPGTVRDDLSNVISYELDRLTPLSPERALYDFRVVAEDAVQVRIQLAAAKSETIQPYLDALGQKGIAIRQVAVAGVEGMNLLDRGRHRARRAPFVLTIVLLAALAVLGVFWLLSPLQSEGRRLAAIDREIASRREEVRQIEARQKEIDAVAQDIAAIGGFKHSRPVMLDLLRELTGVLPRDAWLSRVRLTESTVEIEGYTPSSTEILPKLEASKHFRKVEFSSPTFRDVRLNADRFIIKMEIETLSAERADHEKTQ
jgi:general secretion pathway protein L